MEALDTSTSSPPRGLFPEAAMAHLGVKRRAFDDPKCQLNPGNKGTRLVYNVREQDELAYLGSENA